MGCGVVTTVADSETTGCGVKVGIASADGEGDGEGVSEGVGDGVTDGVGDGVDVLGNSWFAVGDGLGLGVGVVVSKGITPL